MAQERRDHPRYTMWFPVTLGVPKREVWAICKDISQRGILIASASVLEVGVAVTVTFRVAPEDAEERCITGRVVRIDAVSDATAKWPHRIAIAFDRELPELAGQLAARQSSFPPVT